MDEHISKKYKEVKSDKLKKLFKHAVFGKNISVLTDNDNEPDQRSRNNSINKLSNLKRRKRNQSFNSYISIERKQGKRNLLDGIYITEKKVIDYSSPDQNKINMLDPEKTNQLILLRKICGNQIRELKDLFINEDSPIQKYNEYDLNFLLRYYSIKEFDIFDKKYTKIFDTYLYAYIDNDDNFEKHFDLSYIRKLILPKIFSLPIKYLLSYFYLCLNKDHYSVQSILCKALTNIDKDIKIYSVSQYDNLFMNNVLSKDDIVYLLLYIYNNQKNGNIQVTDLYPDVITFFF